MTKPHEPGRNEPCPCGSGKKYKVCCGSAAALAQQNKKKANLFIGVLILGVVLAFSFSYFSAKSTDATSDAAPLTADGPPYPQPPGEPPAGKVWSPEHGHWHDIDPDGNIQTH